MSDLLCPNCRKSIDRRAPVCHWCRTPNGSDIYDVLATEAVSGIQTELQKSLLIGDVEMGKEYCKSMVTTCVTAAGAHLALFSWIAKDRSGALTDTLRQWAGGALILGPVLIFASAAIGFTLGYFALPLRDLTRKPEELGTALVLRLVRTTKSIRNVWIEVCGALFFLGVAATIAVVGLLLANGTVCAPLQGLLNWTTSAADCAPTVGLTITLWAFLALSMPIVVLQRVVTRVLGSGLRTSGHGKRWIPLVLLLGLFVVAVVALVTKARPAIPRVSWGIAVTATALVAALIVVFAWPPRRR